MPVISNRPPGFIAGVAMLLLCSFLFLIGFATPYWVDTNADAPASGHNGIWTLCAATCETIGIDDKPDWFNACRALECIGLLLLFAACVSCVVVSFCRSVPGARSKVMEVTAILGGLAGFVGAMVYVGKTDDLVTASFSDSHYSWSLYLTAIGSIGSVIAAVVIAIFSGNLNNPSSTGVGFSNVLAQPQQGMVFNATANPSQQAVMQGNYTQSPSYYQNMPPTGSGNQKQ